MADTDRGDHAIETRGLNLWYGDFQALHEVDLDGEEVQTAYQHFYDPD